MKKPTLYFVFYLFLSSNICGQEINNTVSVNINSIIIKELYVSKIRNFIKETDYIKANKIETKNINCKFRKVGCEFIDSRYIQHEYKYRNNGFISKEIFCDVFKNIEYCYSNNHDTIEVSINKQTFDYDHRKIKSIKNLSKYNIKGKKIFKEKYKYYFNNNKIIYIESKENDLNYKFYFLYNENNLIKTIRLYEGDFLLREESINYVYNSTNIVAFSNTIFYKLN